MNVVYFPVPYDDFDAFLEWLRNRRRPVPQPVTAAMLRSVVKQGEAVPLLDALREADGEHVSISDLATRLSTSKRGVAGIVGRLGKRLKKLGCSGDELCVGSWDEASGEGRYAMPQKALEAYSVARGPLPGDDAT